MILIRSILKFSFLFILVLWQKTVFGQGDFLASNITDRDGLPQNKIKSIVKDTTGYIWIGTQNGIAKYNGYEFTSYANLDGIEITTLFLSNNNDLWVGTHSGLFLYDRIKDQFHKKSLGDIRHIGAQSGLIYFITREKLYSLTKEENQLLGYDIEDELYLRQLAQNDESLFLGLGKHDGIIKGEVQNDRFLIREQWLKTKVITCLRVINNETWVGTSDGELYQIKEDKLHKITLQNSHPIKDITIHQNKIWVGTDGNGVFILGKINTHLAHRQGFKNLIGSNNIQSILPIDEENIWIGTYDAGIYALSSSHHQFNNLADLYHTELVNLTESATASYQDHSNRLLLGTPGGFVRIDPSTNEKEEIGFDQCKSLLGGTKVLAFSETQDHHILVGTYDGGLGYFDKNLNFIQTFYPFDNEKAEQNISFIFNLTNNKVLVSSMYHGMSIIDLNKGSSKPILLKENGDSIIKYPVQAIRKKGGALYAYIFGKSIYKINTSAAVLEQVFKPDTPINDFRLNEDNTIWLASRGKGLLLSSLDGGLIEQYDTNDGLPSNFLLRIEKDNSSNLWVSSISGLCKIDADQLITVYDHRHGLPSREFTPFTSTILHNGNLLFGTVKGFVLANTTVSPITSSPPFTIISDITFQNRSIKSVDEIELNKPIESLAQLKVPFKYNSFTIHFFNDDYSLPKLNKFKYRMLGLEKEWINLNENTQTTYTNLSPGTYQFEVSSSNKYGIQNTSPTRLTISVSPPWYMTWWAYLSYIISAFGLGYLIYIIMLNRTHMLKELEFSEFRLQTTRDLNEKKLQFFTNITHDFKTPLTLISAPLEELLQDSTINEKGISNLRLIKRNSDRLYHLIIDLLDFRKINNSDSMRLNITQTDMSRFLQDIYDSFYAACEQQRITLTLENHSHDPVFIDIEKVKRILWNILSNSLKFTPSNGQITIISTLHNDQLFLQVTDTGRGMTQHEVDRLFDRYYQTGHEIENKDFGTGLGMAIVKGLVESHRGIIEVVSKPKFGSTFRIVLPATKNHYSEDELIKKPNGNYSYLPPIQSTHTISSPPASTKYNLPKILICEDNPELNAFLVQVFERDFRVETCFNGAEGMELIQKKSPDLIISDVMMPKMDGYEFCKQIKSNLETSHTPVVLLTANSSLDKQIKGMSYGADIYITKPFKTEFLIASVNSVLANRQKLREKFQGLQKFNGQEESITPQDQQFMIKLKDFINNNITNPDLNIELLADEMSCSKSSLTRKVKSLTGITPMAYLKTNRLNMAYEMLAKEKLTVSEVTYKTGFSDPNYFATSFKKQFGKNPSQVSG
ncbi:hybrid sensor histidine kinase/response regulator transcription factor [Marinoscillum pacificum]|uniref:hybrid sensor histidine kinase/response regulator transcription factor n=1 Tax=Marinoscillum pacificum TaxID=392723 RepID=UPI0021582B67|nr:hybrid sensor histidine kinase/response regulator transcription factor [Marinoscillum pacificum]